jgi:hypothetical protein
MPLNTLLKTQQCWAQCRWPGHSGPRAPSLTVNLIRPMSEETEQEFQAGSGGELGRKGRPGKMSSLRSSSALSYNVFGPVATVLRTRGGSPRGGFGLRLTPQAEQDQYPMWAR